MPRRSYKSSPSKKSTKKKSTKKRATKKRAPSSKGKPSPGEDAVTSASQKRAKKKTKATKKSSKSNTVKATSTRKQTQRIQRLLASAGFGSRRQCEELIEEGRVEVDGTVVTELGTTVDPLKCKVRVDGVPLRQQKLVYYAVNKPTGVLSTNADPKGRQRVIDLVPNSERVFPVGRLDASSQGLMLLTNDGDLAQQLSHPRYGVRKVYRVTVAGRIDSETMRNMRKGIYISDGFVRVEGARLIKARAKSTELEITLREGKNREIRRILARLGHKVQVLRRIAIGPLRLGDVPIGMHRKLSRDEVSRLRLAIEHSKQEVEEESPRRGRGKKAGKKGSKKRPGAKRKTAGGKHRPESRKAVTQKRTNRKPKTTKFSFEPKDRGGSVIGGD